MIAAALRLRRALSERVGVVVFYAASLVLGFYSGAAIWASAWASLVGWVMSVIR